MKDKVRMSKAIFNQLPEEHQKELLTTYFWVAGWATKPDWIVFYEKEYGE